MSDDLFTFSLGDDEGLSLEVDDSASTLEQYGFKPSDDLEIDLGFDTAVEDDLLLDLDESLEDALPESILLSNTIDMVVTLTPYYSAVVKNRAALRPPVKEVSETTFAISHSEFPFMPEEVFVVFHQIFLDVVTTASDTKDVSECFEEVSKTLYEATFWSPKLNAPEFQRAFNTWFQQLRKLSRVEHEVHRSDISNLVSFDELDVATDVFALNTVAFQEVNNFFHDTSKFASEMQLDAFAVGAVATAYMEEHNKKALTVNDTYTLVMGCLSGSDMSQLLRLDSDKLLEFSTGELLRRLLHYELENGLMFTFDNASKPAPDFTVLLEILQENKDRDSIASEIILLIASLMLALLPSKEGELPDALWSFMSWIHLYIVTHVSNPAYVNPVCYEKIQKTQDGYSVSYAVGQDTYTTIVADPLCDVIGDRSNIYCTPKACVDKSVGVAVCPASQLFDALRYVSVSGRMRVDGTLSFRYTPTIRWMAANHVLVQDDVAQDTEDTDALRPVGSALLHTLMNYDNAFENTMPEASLTQIKAGGFTMFSATNSVDGLHSIQLIEDSDGCVISSSGSAVLDSDTGNLIVSFTDTGASLTECVFEPAEFELTAEIRRQVTQSVVLQLDDFVCRKGASTDSQHHICRSAVRELCALAAMDYDVELEDTKHVIAHDLANVIRVSALDELLASRMLGYYSEWMTKQKDSGVTPILDAINYSSLKELVGLLLGKPNFLSDHPTWRDDMYDATIKELSFVDCNVTDVCNYLDSLNFDILALHALNQSDMCSNENLDMYNALHYIPEIGSRLCVLEDKLVTMKVLSILGDEVLDVFGRHKFLVKAYMQQLSKANLRDVAHSVMTGMRDVFGKRLDQNHNVFVLSSCVLDAVNVPGISSAKYFVLERNVQGLLTALTAAGDTELCAKLRSSLGDTTGDGYDIDAELRMFSDHCLDLAGIVEQGLLCDLLDVNGMKLAKAFDLFNEYASSQEDTEDFCKYCEQYREAFLNYAGSFVISYCPVIETSQGEIEGGVLRSTAFVQEPKDFVTGVPRSILQSADLYDMRVAVSGE